MLKLLPKFQSTLYYIILQVLLNNKENNFFVMLFYCFKTILLVTGSILVSTSIIEIDELNVLEVNSLSFPDKRTVVRQLLTKWKDTFDAEATWEKIIIALRKIGNNALAQEVEEQYFMSERH